MIMRSGETQMSMRHCRKEGSGNGLSQLEDELEQSISAVEPEDRCGE